jgi:hypothetical protein
MDGAEGWKSTVRQPVVTAARWRVRASGSRAAVGLASVHMPSGQGREYTGGLPTFEGCASFRHRQGLQHLCDTKLASPKWVDLVR